MRRVVVPLDGSRVAASVLPHARLLMGPEGELVLIPDDSSVVRDQHSEMHGDRNVADDAEEYLKGVARTLSDEGVRVRVPGTRGDIGGDNDSAESEWNGDIMAVATQAPDPSQDLQWDSTLRRALAHAAMPILLCPPDAGHELGDESHRRVLVPLDGSETAAAAVALAEDLARWWNASLWLTYVLRWDAQSTAEELGRSEVYLRAIARDLDCDARINIVVGRSAWTMLTREVIDRMVTDVVMTTHGRTANTRCMVGSVAEKLIRHLQCRIFVITPTASRSMERARTSRSTAPFLWSSGSPMHTKAV